MDGKISSWIIESVFCFDTKLNKGRICFNEGTKYICTRQNLKTEVPITKLKSTTICKSSYLKIKVLLFYFRWVSSFIIIVFENNTVFSHCFLHIFAAVLQSVIHCGDFV
ncbi:hypothetical protein MKW98_001108 [Papaver atlanticum]|uniref:Uncharacterized protein n=1 Tax=Papaver atlanticum TaxID=357466 RepID=A0AAD4SUG6_9MAGN|nr:hypothetical protein MKW98_001108 [Papaver atlanticum]